jgi:hypothetical protein
MATRRCRLGSEKRPFFQRRYLLIYWVSDKDQLVKNDVNNVMKRIRWVLPASKQRVGRNEEECICCVVFFTKKNVETPHVAFGAAKG